MAIEYLENIPLGPMTTFRVGGNARYFVEATDEETIRTVFGEAGDRDVFVLGGGSNVLISDSGFDGVVLKIGYKGISLGEERDGLQIMTANAGEDWDDLVEYCVSADLAGIECLSGIPGLVGATPIQNVGAYGQEVSETIVSVRVLERRTGAVFEIENGECGFEYRKSIFNTSEKDRYVVLSVTYALRRGGSPKIAYADVEKRVGGRRPTLREVRETVKSIRAEKGMLVRQGGPDAQSAGSFFKNPVVDSSKLQALREALLKEGLDDEVPFYEQGGGRYKVPAAWLIERAGFQKGFRMGMAGISDLHALALTNRGDATAREIVALKTKIERAISDKFGIELETEPNLVGFR